MQSYTISSATQKYITDWLVFWPVVQLSKAWTTQSLVMAYQEQGHSTLSLRQCTKWIKREGERWLSKSTGSIFLILLQNNISFMADNSFIKLYRKITDWEWYDDINTTRLFLHLLLTVNFEDKVWHWIEVKKWEIITSLSKLSYETWLSVKEIRGSLERLKKTNEVASKSTNTYSHIQLINWEMYQSKGQANGQANGKQLGIKRATTKEIDTKVSIKKERIGKSFFSYQEGNEFQEPFWFIYSNFIIEKREVLDECFKMGQWIEDHDDKPRYNWKSFVSNWLLKSYKRRQKPLEMQQPVEPALPQPPPSEKSESFHITDLLQEEEQVDA